MYLSFETDGPTLPCSGRRWRGPGAGRDFGAWWRASARAGLWRTPAAPLKAGVGPSGKNQPSAWIGGVPTKEWTEGQRITRQHDQKRCSCKYLHTTTE